MSTIKPADWAARAAHIRQSVPADQLSDTTLAMVLNSFLMADDEGRAWAFNGFSWSMWDGQQWSQSTPPAELQLQSFAPEEEAAQAAPVVESPEIAQPETAFADTAVAEAAIAEPQVAQPEPEAAAAPEPEPEPVHELAPEPESQPKSEPEAQPFAAAEYQAQPAPTQPTQPQPSAAFDPTRPHEPAQWPQPAQPAPAVQYRATHAVPAPGIAAWSRPDPTIAPEFRLWPGLDVMVVEWLPSGWARVVTSNQWSGWVDGRILLPYR